MRAAWAPRQLLRRPVSCAYSLRQKRRHFAVLFSEGIRLCACDIPRRDAADKLNRTRLVTERQPAVALRVFVEACYASADSRGTAPQRESRFPSAAATPAREYCRGEALPS